MALPILSTMHNEESRELENSCVSLSVKSLLSRPGVYEVLIKMTSVSVKLTLKYFFTIVTIKTEAECVKICNVEYT